MSSSLSFDENEDGDLEKDLEWDNDEKVVTTWSTNAKARPPRRTFASRRKQQPQARSRSTARKALMMTNEAPSSTEDNSLSFLTDHAASKRLTRCDAMQSSHSTSSLKPKASRSLTELTSDFSDLGAPPVLGRKSKNITRSSTLPPPLPSKPPRFQRSFSLALGSPIPGRNRLRENLDEFRASFDDDAHDGVPVWALGENEHPNHQNIHNSPEELADELLSEDSRGRKKHRARRASIQGTIPSLSAMFKRNASEEFGITAPPLPSAKEPLRSLSASASPSKANRALELIDYPMNTSSPASSSKASGSRKRGVCGSPISDIMDDLSTGGMSVSMNSTSSMSHRRSRSRIYSPPGGGIPMPASLNPPLLLKSTQKEQRAFLPHECRGMEDDNVTDDDEEQSLNDDLSFTNSTEIDDSHHDLPIITIDTNGHEQHGEEKKESDIFDSMSSYQDLKFLIKALRKEATSNYIGNNSKSWTVAPPTAWTSSRRTAFYRWTTSEFQFRLRPLGNSVNCLQVSRTKGEIVLKQLEDALVAFKEHEQKLAHLPDKDPMPQTPFGESALDTNTPYNAKPVFPTAPHTADSVVNDGTEELMAGLQSMSMSDSRGGQTDASVKRGSLFSGDGSSRPSLDHSARSSFGGAARPSFDHSVVGSADMMFHIHGHGSPSGSPQGGEGEGENPIRPPKISLNSVMSNSTRGRLSAPHAPIQNIELMETPQIKQDEGWGSRPIAGKDWGSSSPCDEAVVEKLTVCFEEACRLAGGRESMGSCGGLPVMPGGLDLDEVEQTETGEEQVDEDVFMEDGDDERQARRIRVSFAKHKRISLWAAASQDGGPLLPTRKSAFNRERQSVALLPVEESSKSLHEYEDSFPIRETSSCETVEDPTAQEAISCDGSILSSVFSYLTESELLCKASLVSTAWAGAATTAHAALMMASVGYMDEDSNNEGTNNEETTEETRTPASVSMDKDWCFLTRVFPWACFLSSGAFKRVFKVYNTSVGAEEAVSVMDVDAITDKKTIAAELVVSAMLSAMARRAICPNFVITHGVFTLPYDIPVSHWGSETNKKPKGAKYCEGKKINRPRRPKQADPGRYQFIRMELCNEGDFEEFLKRQDSKCLHKFVAQTSLFQIAFALHAAADKYSLKHYDIKLLNVFVQRMEVETPNVALRYGLGSHVYSLQIPSQFAYFAKLADYGTANIQAESTGQPVTIAQFTTLENTPPDFLILGDEATQGHGHDNFGLGLSMLHLFTGHAPYEEILEDVVCPPMLKKKLRAIWENEKVTEYSVVRSIVLSDVYKDEHGHILEGEPDETLYDTLYRFLVLFGIPEEKFEQRKCPLVWKAITESLCGKATKSGRIKKQGTDISQFERDSDVYSVLTGSERHIARAREALSSMEGGLDLLFNLCSFDPRSRATALQVLNSPFMASLREPSDCHYGVDTTVFSYSAFSTHS